MTNLLQRGLIGGALLTLTFTGNARADAFAPPGGVQGYVLTSFFFGVYETKSRVECGNGLNPGPRDQIAAQFPKVTAGQLAPGLTLEEIFIRREAGNFWPQLWDEKLNPLPWIEPTSKISFGLNLDGKVKPTDYSAPTAEQCKASAGLVHRWGDIDPLVCNAETGVDNELYRVMGCAAGWRTNGSEAAFGDDAVRYQHYDRLVMELTNVENLENDDDVNVAIYRALDPVIMDGMARPMAGTTQRVDEERGSRFVNKFHGKIVGGVLMTEPSEYFFPWMNNKGYQVHVTERVHDMRMKVKLTPTTGEGVMGGYIDIAMFFDNLSRSRRTENHRGFTGPGIWKQMQLRADGYPDATGKNTAISTGMLVKFTQAFIEHGNTGKKLAQTDAAK